MKECESTGFTGDGMKCTRYARFRVIVGTRKYDAQFSCAVHLPATVRALTEADNRSSVSVFYRANGFRDE